MIVISTFIELRAPDESVRVNEAGKEAHLIELKVNRSEDFFYSFINHKPFIQRRKIPIISPKTITSHQQHAVELSAPLLCHQRIVQDIIQSIEIDIIQSVAKGC